MTAFVLCDILIPIGLLAFFGEGAILENNLMLFPK